jgi:hypothetical protein
MLAAGAGESTAEAGRRLQTLGEFDWKTSGWVKTPPDIRPPGGALFGDRRPGLPRGAAGLKGKTAIRPRMAVF